MKTSNYWMCHLDHSNDSQLSPGSIQTAICCSPSAAQQGCGQTPNPVDAFHCVIRLIQGYSPPAWDPYSTPSPIENRLLFHVFSFIILFYRMCVLCLCLCFFTHLFYFIISFHRR